MAFCNSCGATLDAGGKFCPKCGAAGPAASPSVPSAPAQSGSGLKIVLIVVAVVVGLGILGAATAGFMAWRIARHSRVETSGDKVRVETPFGTVESAKDSTAAVRNLGVDVYPGARALKDSAATVTMGGMKTVAAEFETSDPPDKVADFYKQKFPHASVTESDQKHYAIISTDKKGMVTINIEAEDGTTRIHIANMSGKMDGGSN